MVVHFCCHHLGQESDTNEEGSLYKECIDLYCAEDAVGAGPSKGPPLQRKNASTFDDDDDAADEALFNKCMQMTGENPSLLPKADEAAQAPAYSAEAELVSSVKTPPPRAPSCLKRVVAGILKSPPKAVDPLRQSKVGTKKARAEAKSDGKLAKSTKATFKRGKKHKKSEQTKAKKHAGADGGEDTHEPAKKKNKVKLVLPEPAAASKPVAAKVAKHGKVAKAGKTQASSKKELDEPTAPATICEATDMLVDPKDGRGGRGRGRGGRGGPAATGETTKAAKAAKGDERIEPQPGCATTDPLVDTKAGRGGRGRCRGGGGGKPAKAAPDAAALENGLEDPDALIGKTMLERAIKSDIPVEAFPEAPADTLVGKHSYTKEDPHSNAKIEVILPRPKKVKGSFTWTTGNYFAKSHAVGDLELDNPRTFGWAVHGGAADAWEAAKKKVEWTLQ